MRCVETRRKEEGEGEGEEKAQTIALSAPSYPRTLQSTKRAPSIKYHIVLPTASIWSRTRPPFRP